MIDGVVDALRNLFHSLVLSELFYVIVEVLVDHGVGCIRIDGVV